MRQNSVKAKLRRGEASIGTWLTMGSITAARFLAQSGFDWLTIDTEHNPIGLETTAHMIAGIAAAGGIPLVRVPGHSQDHIKQTLDAGSYGIIAPMVNSSESARSLTAACQYPPRGTRSVGGSLHALAWQTTPAVYHQHADDELLVVLQCEHRTAVENFESIFGGGGVDVVFVGPHDLAASYRAMDGTPPNAADIELTLHQILQHCQRLGLIPGIHTGSIAEAQKRLSEGWRFIAVGSDLKMLMEQAAYTMLELRGLPGVTEMVRY
jgi:4-hydroxy-2-oxoheptanedioate aldolase